MYTHEQTLMKLAGELANYPGGAKARIAVVEDPGIAQGGIEV